MAKHTFILTTCLFLHYLIMGQPVVDLSKGEILTYMKQNEPDFVLDNSTINHKFKYLKYVDKLHEETLLIFLSPDDHCTMTRRSSDYSNLNLALKKLDNNCKKEGKSTWTYKVKDQVYIIELTRDKWYFKLETRKK